MMTKQAEIQITGYRKDRLGARIIALANLLCLRKKFGVEVVYLWPDAFESHDMAVTATDHPIFDIGFRDEFIREIPAETRPDIDALTNIEKLSGHLSTDLFQKRITEGERFLCNEGIHPVLFANEMGETHMAAFRDAAADIVYAPRIREVVDQAAAKLTAMEGRPKALHVRRGDVLDKDPWLHKNWVSKFAPDEFYETVMDNRQGAALLFSDTPVVARRLAADRVDAFTLDDLIDAPDLSEMQRDLVELLLMARCSEIVAPSLSAFSSSAAMIGGMTVVELPQNLPEDERFAAYDRLLERVLTGPASFHNDGDFAQSLGYAFRHALNTKRHHALNDVLTDAIDVQAQPYAFYLPLAMSLGLACAKPERTRLLDARARSNSDLWPDDRLICATLGRIADHVTAPDADGRQAAEADFLRLYLSRHKTDPDLDALANYFFAHGQGLRQLFMIDDLTRDTFGYGRAYERIFLAPVDDDLYDGALNTAFPIWVVAGDWHEMFEKHQILKNMTKRPDLQAKKTYVPPDIKQAELAHFKDGKALPTDTRSVTLMSVYAAALSLSGRYQRASNLLFHCRKCRPEDPLILKRLANRFRLTGHNGKALNNLGRARAAAPDHIGLGLAMAEILQAQDDHKGVVTLLDGFADDPFLPFAFYKVWEKSLRKLKARDAQAGVIAAAYTHYPDHEIFTKQWAGKV